MTYANDLAARLAERADRAMETPNSADRGSADARGWSARPASDFAIVPVRFAWEGRIPLGAVTAFVGEPGKGKSAVALELLARISRGQLVGDLHGVPCTSLYLSAEDAPEHTLGPRLRVAGADMDLVRYLTVRVDGFDADATLPEDLDKLRAAITGHGVRVVVIDPLTAHLGNNVDSHNDHDVRRVLAPLARIAAELDVAVVVIVHTNKSDATDVFRRTGGSIGISGAVRSLLFFAADPDADEGDEYARVIVHGKANIAEVQSTLRYRTEGRAVSNDDGTQVVTARGEPFTTAGIAWSGESAATIADVLGRQGNSRRASPARDAARAMLAEVLPPGETRPAAMIHAEADARGIAWRTVERAKAEMGVESVPDLDGTGKVRGWLWVRPLDNATHGATPMPARVGGGLDTPSDAFVPQQSRAFEKDHAAIGARGVGDVASWSGEAPVYDPTDSQRFTR
jgi:hypothetical protein